MSALFLACSLMASWLGLPVLAGLGYAGACALVPVIVGQRSLLHVVVAPPGLFLLAVLVSQALTAQGTTRHGKAMSVLEGTTLTLAAIAPWLLAGTAVEVGISWTRGLRQCISQLQAELRGEIISS